tara:strand:+ start:2003 stop:2212 length:210 start_codon:yes stop_codon:yes gene_type:complete
MKKTIINTYTAIIVLAIGMASFLFVQMQSVVANLKRSAEAGKNIRVAERDSCTTQDDVNVTFSGCNSIL